MHAALHTVHFALHVARVLPVAMPVAVRRRGDRTLLLLRDLDWRQYRSVLTEVLTPQERALIRAAYDMPTLEEAPGVLPLDAVDRLYGFGDVIPESIRLDERFLRVPTHAA